jgi:hypothetical protein
MTLRFLIDLLSERVATWAASPRAATAAHRPHSARLAYRPAANALFDALACLSQADSMSRRMMLTSEGLAIAFGLVRVLRASVRCGGGRV